MTTAVMLVSMRAHGAIARHEGAPLTTKQAIEHVLKGKRRPMTVPADLRGRVVMARS
jgi:hypothetical protein